MNILDRAISVEELSILTITLLRLLWHLHLAKFANYPTKKSVFTSD